MARWIVGYCLPWRVPTICICIINLALVVEDGPSVNHSVPDAFLFKAIVSSANSSFNIQDGEG